VARKRNRTIKDLVGKKFNKLTVQKRINPNKLGVEWLCLCDCGGEKTITTSQLKRIKSCGCLQKEVGKRVQTHGLSKTKEFKIWLAMKDRCFREKNPRYKSYGGRGITVCERWLKFENFIKDMGSKPKNKSLDRKNNNGNYEPSNCRWATSKQQANNRRNNVGL
jgi:hypothetical protein